MTEESRAENLLRQLIDTTKADRDSVLRQTEKVLEFLAQIVAESIDVPSEMPKEPLRPMKGGKCVLTTSSGTPYEYAIRAVEDDAVWLRSSSSGGVGVLVYKDDFERKYIVISEPS